MKKIVEIISNVSKNVYVASIAPPVRHINIYGIDIPNENELIACGSNLDQISENLGSKCIFYQQLDDICDTLKELNPSIDEFECSMFNGIYKEK